MAAILTRDLCRLCAELIILLLPSLLLTRLLSVLWLPLPLSSLLQRLGLLLCLPRAVMQLPPDGI